MKPEKGFWSTEMPLYKRVILFPVWLFANIYTAILMVCMAFVPVAIFFEIWDWFW